MRKTTLLILLLGLTTLVHGQRKSELLEQIDTLKSELRSAKDSLAQLQRLASANKAKAATLESQNAGLRDANATLLKNLNGFAEISSKNTETVNKALASLKEKEQQQKFITDTFSQNDSTAIVLLTKGKQTLGEGAKLGVSNGAIVIANSLASLFGSDVGVTVGADANEWLTRVAGLLNEAPDRDVIIEGLNITGEFDLTLQQVAAVAATLIKDHGVAAERIRTSVKDGNFKEGINIRLAPSHRGFYDKVKENFKG